MEIQMEMKTEPFRIAACELRTNETAPLPDCLSRFIFAQVLGGECSTGQMLIADWPSRGYILNSGLQLVVARVYSQLRSTSFAQQILRWLVHQHHLLLQHFFVLECIKRTCDKDSLRCPCLTRALDALLYGKHPASALS
eukprot:1192785-Prorocentrum_minimum.AAC.4